MQIRIYMLLEMDDIIGLIVLGAVHKRRPQSGEGGGGGLISADILRTRGVDQCGYFSDKGGWFFR